MMSFKSLLKLKQDLANTEPTYDKRTRDFLNMIDLYNKKKKEKELEQKKAEASVNKFFYENPTNIAQKYNKSKSKNTENAVFGISQRDADRIDYTNKVSGNRIQRERYKTRKQLAKQTEKEIYKSELEKYNAPTNRLSRFITRSNEKAPKLKTIKELSRESKRYDQEQLNLKYDYEKNIGSNKIFDSSIGNLTRGIDRVLNGNEVTRFRNKSMAIMGGDDPSKVEAPSTGNKGVDSAIDIISTLYGYTSSRNTGMIGINGENLGIAKIGNEAYESSVRAISPKLPASLKNSAMRVTESITSKLPKSFVSKNPDVVEKISSYIAEGIGTTIPISLFESAKQEKDIGESTKKLLADVAIGTGLSLGIRGILKGAKTINNKVVDDITPSFGENADISNNKLDYSPENKINVLRGRGLKEKKTNQNETEIIGANEINRDLGGNKKYISKDNIDKYKDKSIYRKMSTEEIKKEMKNIKDYKEMIRNEHIDSYLKPSKESDVITDKFGRPTKFIKSEEPWYTEHYMNTKKTTVTQKKYNEYAEKHLKNGYITKTSKEKPSEIYNNLSKYEKDMQDIIDSRKNNNKKILTLNNEYKKYSTNFDNTNIDNFKRTGNNKVVGKIEEIKREGVSSKDIKRDIKNVYGLNEESSPESIKNSFNSMYNDIGEYISNKHETKDLNTILDRYKNKYNLKNVNLKEVKFKNKNIYGNTKVSEDGINISINKNLSDNQKIGVLRHEIEHTKDKVLDNYEYANKAGKNKYQEGKTIDEIYNNPKHHKNYDFFEKNYITNKNIMRDEPIIKYSDLFENVNYKESENISNGPDNANTSNDNVKFANKNTTSNVNSNNLNENANTKFSDNGENLTGKKGTSKFKETVKSTLNEETKVKFNEKEYGKVSNKLAWEESQKRVKNDYEGLKNNIYGKKGNEFSHQDVSDSQAIIKKMIDEGKHDDANQFIDHVTDKLTKAGQTISAAKLWRRQTATGAMKYYSNSLKKVANEFKKNNGRVENIENQVSMLQKEIKKIESNKKITETMNAEIVDKQRRIKQLLSDKQYKAYKDIKFSDKDVEFVSNEFKKIEKMPDGYDKDFAIAKVNKYISKKIPVSLGSKISSIQTISQLLNFKTTDRNIISNLMFGALENTSQVLKTGLDIATPGERTTFLPSIIPQIKGGIKGFKRGLKESIHGVNTMSLGGQYDLKNATFSGKGIINKIFRPFEKALNVTLSATDRGFYQASFERNAYNQAKKILKSEGKNFSKGNILDALEKINTDESNFAGLYSTFQDSNSLSDAFKGIKRKMNLEKDWGFGDIAFKYAKTTASLFSKSIDYSPLSIVKGLTKIAYNASKKNKINKEEFINNLGNGLVGTSLVTMAGIMHKMGIITTGYSGNKKVESFKNDTGMGNYSINIDALKRYVLSGFDKKYVKQQKGDNILTYDWLQPISTLVAGGAELNKQIESNTKNIFGAIASVMDASVNVVAEQPMLQGIQNLFKYGLTKGFTKTLTDIPSSFVPSLLNHARQLVDNQKRDTSVKNIDKLSEPEKIFQQSKNIIMNKIPGLSKNLPAKYNISGKKDTFYKKVDPVTDFMNSFISPSSIKKLDTSKNKKFLLDLYNSTGSTKQFPQLAPKKYVIYGKKIDLNFKEQEQVQKYISKESNNALKELKLYKDKSMSDEEKIQMIKSVYSRISRGAKYMILEKKGY